MNQSLIILLLFFSWNHLVAQNEIYTEYYPNGNVKIKGVFNMEGQKEGEWIVLDSISADTVSLFTFSNGKLNGRFVSFYVGTNYKSKFITSQLHNYSNWKDEKFKVSGSYINDTLHGNYIEYYENGQVHIIGFYSNGLKSEEFREYHDNGNLSFIKNYDNDILIEIWCQYYNTGKLREERTYENGVHLTTIITEWYDNGNMKNSTAYKILDDKKVNHGKSLVYYDNGQIQLSSFYENGKPNGKWENFYQNGITKYIIIYEDFIYQSFTEFDAKGIKKQRPIK